MDTARTLCRFDCSPVLRYDAAADFLESTLLFFGFNQVPEQEAINTTGAPRRNHIGHVNPQVALSDIPVEIDEAHRPTVLLGNHRIVSSAYWYRNLVAHARVKQFLPCVRDQRNDPRLSQRKGLNCNLVEFKICHFKSNRIGNFVLSIYSYQVATQRYTEPEGPVCFE